MNQRETTRAATTSTGPGPRRTSWGDTDVGAPVDCMMAADEHGTITLIHQQEPGGDNARLVGKKLWSIVKAGQRQGVKTALADCFSRGTVTCLDALAGAKNTAPMLQDGLYRLRIGPTRMVDDRLEAIVTLRDTTVRRHATRAHWQLSRAVEQAHESVVITDLEGRILYVNPAFEQASGYSSDEVVGETPRLLSSGKQSKGFYKELWDTIKGGRVWTGLFHNRRKDGSEYIEEATISPVFDDEKTVVNFVAVKKDITQRVALEQQLRQSQKLEAVGQLASGIAHEINTPTQFVRDNTVFVQRATHPLIEALRSIEAVVSKLELETPDSTELRAASQALASCQLGFVQEQLPRALEQSLEGLDRITTIVGAMKDFSHPSANELAPMDLHKLIHTTVTVARNEWRYVAEIETDLDPEVRDVYGVRDQLGQVLLNLIVNAVHAIEEKANHDGTCKGRIRIQTKRSERWHEIRVQDTGAGVPANVIDRIFDPFFTTKDVGKGSGQGLSLAHHIIADTHQGEIECTSVEGDGATFVIRLPREPSANTAPKRES